MSGKIIKAHKNDAGYKDHTHHASADEPQYEIKSGMTEDIAMPMVTTLHKSSWGCMLRSSNKLGDVNQTYAAKETAIKRNHLFLDLHQTPRSAPDSVLCLPVEPECCRASPRCSTSIDQTADAKVQRLIR